MHGVSRRRNDGGRNRERPVVGFERPVAGKLDETDGARCGIRLPELFDHPGGTQF